MGILNFLFGSKKGQVKEFIERDAIILDVRTEKEWDRGHIDKAIHIPLSDLSERIENVKQLKAPIITCCASGVRSAQAARILAVHNLEAINGGSWLKLKHQL